MRNENTFFVSILREELIRNESMMNKTTQTCRRVFRILDKRSNFPGVRLAES
jgi:hypothetical protein